MRNGNDPSRARRLWSTVVLACVVALGSVLSASPALAHGAGETEEGYLLVQQALGHLAHDTTMTGIELAMEKIDDALNTKDREGVNVAEVKQAKVALDAGDVAQARALLQHSISEALSKLMPATGEETGTRVLLSAEAGRGRLALGGWVTLMVSALFLLVGFVVAWRFRPEDSVRDLRRRLGASPRLGAVTGPGTPSEDAS